MKYYIELDVHYKTSTFAVVDKKRHSLPTEPRRVLAGNITCLRLKTGRNFLYLAVVLDLFNRGVVS